ncbi:MAG: cysteine dioxygenase family protein [Cyanobacteria bacterium P01_H01_bin.152]
MFVEIVENAAKVLVLESIRDEALGDLWEIDNQLKQAGKSRVWRLARSLQYFCSLVKASIILWMEEYWTQEADAKDSPAGNSQTLEIATYKGSTLTAEEFRQVKQYCATRRLYGLGLSRKLLGLPQELSSYWIRQAERVIDKCLAQGEKVIDAEAIANSFLLSSLIRQVESVPPYSVDVHTFHRWVEQVELDESFLNRYVSFDDELYKRQLVCRTWSLVVYVISWLPGQEVGVHHHGYALDAIRVIRGAMTHWLVPPEHWEESIPFEGFEHSRHHEGPSEVFQAGDVVAIDRRHGHQIANCSDQPLVTLHFRFGHPPEDRHWRSTNDAEMLVWNQTEGCFDLIPPDVGRFTSSPLS